VSQFIVTVTMGREFERSAGHNPQQKQEGPCPVLGNHCTDITGAHHSVLMESHSLTTVRLDAQHRFPSMRITRIEKIS
jgi:hypothetical protein